MRKNILKLTVVLLIFSGVFMACEKPAIIDPEIPHIQSLEGIWKCIPEPDVTIILSFDSVQSMAYASTVPKDLVYIDTVNNIWDDKYLIWDGCEYFTHGDTLYLRYANYRDQSWFAVTRLSSDSIKLEYVGGTYLGGVTYVKTYLFNRKIS